MQIYMMSLSLLCFDAAMGDALQWEILSAISRLWCARGSCSVRHFQRPRSLGVILLLGPDMIFTVVGYCTVECTSDAPRRLSSGASP